MRSIQLVTRSVRVLMFVVAVATAADVFAQDDFDYTFESLEEGDLDGQDGWIVWGAAVGRVAHGIGVNTTKAAFDPAWPKAQDPQSFRPLQETFYYTAADTAVIWQSEGLVGTSTSANRTSMVGIRNSFNGAAFGISSLGSGVDDVFAYLAGNQGYYGDQLLAGSWYQMRLVVDFSVTGGVATLWYRNMTAGQTTFQADESIHDVNLGLPPDGQGRYMFNTLYVRQTHASYTDNIHFEAPSPPCPADVAPAGGNGFVNIDDLTGIILAWGTADPAADINNDNIVDIDDLLAVILAWGSCS